MFSESWERTAMSQPAVQQPAPQLLLPAPEVPPASPEQVRATVAVFSTDEQSASAAILGMWSAGMLVHDLLQDTCMLAKEAEAEERERKRKSPSTE